MQVRKREMTLVCVKQIVHLPELALARGGLGGFSREERVRVNLFQREVAIDEADAPGEALEQQPADGSRLLAVRTFEIAVLDDRDGCVRRADDVVRDVFRIDSIVTVSHMECSFQRAYALE